MAKVAEINSGLKLLKEKLSSKPTRDTMLEQLFDSLFDAVHRNSSKLSDDVQTRLVELKNAMQDIQASSEKTSGDSLQKITAELNKIMSSFVRGQNQASTALINRVGTFEAKAATNHQSVKKQIDKAVGDSIGKIKQEIQGIPKTDLSEFRDALIELATQKEPDFTSITARLDRPKEWEFEFVYETLGNKIDKVIATEVK